MEYNTERNGLKLREYGRNIQNLVKHIENEPDKEKRNQYAESMVTLMKQINPNLSKDTNDYDQKIWDDLYLISGFGLEVDAPYPKPEPSELEKKPERMTYYSNEIKYKHYGRSIELLIEKAVELEDEQEQKGAVIVIGKLMKSFYQIWNKDGIEDEQVLMNIKKMSNNKLEINIEDVKELKLFDLGKPPVRHHRNNIRKGGGRRHSGGSTGRHRKNN